MVLSRNAQAELSTAVLRRGRSALSALAAADDNIQRLRRQLLQQHDPGIVASDAARGKLIAFDELRAKRAARTPPTD